MKWQKWITREGVDLTTLFEVDRAFYGLISEYTGQVEENFFTTLSKRIFTHYIGLDDQAMGRFLYKKYLGQVEDIKNLVKQGNKILNEAKKNVRFWVKEISGEAENREKIILALNEFIAQFSKINKIYSIMSFWAIESWQKDFQESLAGMISRNYLLDRIDEITGTVLRPWKKTPIVELGERLKVGEPPEILARDYQYLRSWSIVWHVPIKTEWVLSLKSEGVKAASGGRSLAGITKLLKPNAQEKWFLEIAPYMIYFKDWRDDLRRSHVFEWSFLYDAIARFLSVKRDDLGFITLSEMLSALKKGEVDEKMLSVRKKSLCVVTSGAGKISMKVLCGDKAVSYKKIIENIEQENKLTLVKGLTAQKGMVKGKVQLIRSASDIKAFKNGLVLVANSTHPNYLPAMHKAVAIVTDEGGIASHAAIVAREMKKPCIVGTKIATKVLKDGMMVEVDANKGIVKIIK